MADSKGRHKKVLPFIVVIIDELNLMLVAAKG